LAGETEALGEKLPQRHFVHHKVASEATGHGEYLANAGWKIFVTMVINIFVP
jgi:hypothetical protein